MAALLKVGSGVSELISGDQFEFPCVAIFTQNAIGY